MQPMTAKEDAASILAHIYGHVDAFRASPPREAEQFAAAGLMRCCALLQGILVLDERMPVLTGILVRQHWETWLVSLYVLLDGDEALEVLVADNIYRMRQMRPMFEALRLEVDHHYDSDPDSVKEPKPLNYKRLHERVRKLLRKGGESVDGPAGVTDYHVIYGSDSLFSTHANLFTIGGHLVWGDDECAVSVDSSHALDDDVVRGPVIFTNHLAQRVFEKFGLDGDAIPGRFKEARGIPKSPTRRAKAADGPLRGQERGD